MNQQQVIAFGIGVAVGYWLLPRIMAQVQRAS